MTSVAFVLAALLLQGRPQQGPGPDVGNPAPAFKLKSQDGKTEVDLATLKGKPALLVFGSYT